MEFLSKIRWILVIIIVVIAVILVGWGLASIARNIFDGRDNSEETTTAETTSDEATLDTTQIATFITEGPVVATSEQRSYRIEVTPASVTMKVYSNYGQVLLNEKSYTNTVESYNEFMTSLEKSNITARVRGTTTEDDYEDEGVCPTGERYIVEFGPSFRRWATSCGSADRNTGGTAPNQLSTARTLFQSQVPDFDELVSGTGL